MAFGYYTEYVVQGSLVPSTQTDFTVLLDLDDTRYSTPGGGGGHVQSGNGYDLQTFSNTGLSASLPYYLEPGSYNATLGRARIWVKRTIGTSNTSIYVGYGDAGITTDGSSSSAWDGSTLAFFHFGTSSTLSLVDTTSNGKTWTSNSGVVAGAGPGTANDGAATFASLARLRRTTSPVNTGANFTMSMWLYPTTLSLSAGYASLGTDNNIFGLYLIQIGFGPIDTRLDFYAGPDTYGNTPLVVNTWQMLHLAVSGNNGKFYYNGSLDRDVTGGGLFGSYNVTDLGSDDNNEAFTGRIGSYKISSGQRSADWITCEYRTSNAPNTFSVKQSETTVGGGGGNTLTSSQAMPLGGAVNATVAVAAQSSQALPMGGSVNAQVAISAQSAQALPLGGSANVTAAIQAQSAQALPLSGAANATVAIAAQSSQALPLGGSINTVNGGAGITSTQPLPLGGSVLAAVALAMQSVQALPFGGAISVATGIAALTNQALPLSGSAQARVSVAATSSQGLPLGGAVQAAVALLLQSVQALPLGGSASATSQSGLQSIQPIPLGGSIQTRIAISAQSAMALALGGSVVVKTNATVNSSAALPLGGFVQASILLRASSVQQLPLGGSVQARLNLSATIIIDPLGIKFELVPTGLEFELSPTGILFVNQVGGEIMGPFKIRQGELVPIIMTWTAKGVPVDFTNVVTNTLRWSVYKMGQTPIIDNKQLAVYGNPTQGRVIYNPSAPEVAVRGRYIVEGVAQFLDGQRRKFPGEGETAELIIGYSVHNP